MTPEQLKASILQYAIQGKLVEQRPEEGTGEELYQKMQTDKQTLIREKKIKKEKPLNTQNPVSKGFSYLFIFYAIRITPERMASAQYVLLS